jgi:endonuclease-3
MGPDKAGPFLSPEERARWAKEIVAVFDRLYPEARCGLNYRSPFELLVATILSAQCTDERVNQVCPRLMEAYPGPREMAQAPLEGIEALIKSCGFFRHKAKSLKEASFIIASEHGGGVPGRLEDLVKLPGVGRKTANVVLGNAFGIPGLTVDTHLGRVSRRLGLSLETDPEKVERDLMEIVPRERWTLFSHQAISHGRSLCRARGPLCRDCPIGECPARLSG